MSRKIQTTDYLRSLIKKNCLEVYKEKGLKFTMDDIARMCKISKKTLYIVFKDKEALFVDIWITRDTINCVRTNNTFKCG